MINQKDYTVDYRKYIDILIKQKSFVIIFCLSAILSSLALTYIFSERYETGVAFFYQPREQSLLSFKVNEAFGAPIPSTSYKIISQTLSDLMKSDVILRPLVKKLHLDEEIEEYEPIWYKRWYKETKEYVKDTLSKSKMIFRYGRIIEVDPTDEAIQHLRKYLKIKTTKESYVYLLIVRDKYPRRAAQIVDTAGEMLVNWLKEQNKNPAEDRRDQILYELERKENDIKALQKEKEDLLRKYNIYSITEEMDEVLRSLYSLEQESIQISSLIEEKRRKNDELEREMQKKRTHHPDDYKRMKTEKLFEEIEMNGLTSKQKSIKASIDEYKTKLNEMPSLQKRIDELEMKIAAETDEYKHLKDFYLESSSQATIEHNETKVLHAAPIPTEPVQPIKIYHVGLTAFLSLFFSTGLIYIFDFFNIRMFFSSPDTNENNHSSDKTTNKDSV